MKSFKLLAALAMPIVFAACTSEELCTNEINAPQKMEEVVGTKLLGTDLSLNFSVGGDAESRLTTAGSWQKTDLLGLGWLVNNDNPMEDQHTGKVTTSKLYNNPMFAWNEDKKMFTASGNMFEGWYFGYYPWSYLPKPGSYKTVTVNPEQVSSNPNDRLSQLLHLTNRQFVSADPETGDIDTKTGTINKAFQAFPVLNVLAVKTVAKKGSKFEKENGVLAGCNIESVTISTDKNIFSDGELTIYAARIPEYNDAMEVIENQEALEAKLVGGDYPIFGTTLTNTVTTTVAAGVYAAGDNASIYTLLVPATGELGLKDVVINVKVDCGDFVISHKDGEFEEGSPEQINNAAIENIVAYFAKDGALTSIAKNADNQLAVQSVNVVLYDGNFVPDFTNVTAENWASKVLLANDLELTNPQFTLAPNAEIVLSSKLPLPANGVTVMGSTKNKLIVDNSYTWTEKLVLGNTKVEVLVEHKDPNKVAKLTLSAGVELTNKVTNNGQIIVKGMTKSVEGATLGAKSGNLVNNGVVYVEYGAFVYPNNATKANSIVYKLPKNYNFGYIKDMTTAGAAGSANVNTLEINSDIELNCKKTIVSGGEAPNGNPYNPTTGSDPIPGEDILSLEGLNLWINGTGKVSATAPYAYKVKDVVINGGELSGIGIAGNVTLDGTTSISNGDIAGNVTVKGGEATISNGDIASGVTVEAGSIEISNGDITGDVTVDGTANVSNGDITGNVTVDGTANISNGVITGNVTLASGESNFADVSIYGTLEIKAGATVNMSKEIGAIKITNIINKGKLTSTSDINVENIETENCVVKVESTADAMDKVIWFSDKYEQKEGIQLSGRILPAGTSVEFLNEIEIVKKGETVTINSDLTTVEWKDLNPNNVEYILDLNGNTLTLTDKSVKDYANTNKNLTIKNGKIKNAIFVKDIKATFENITFEYTLAELGSRDLGVIYLQQNAEVKLTNCTFKTDARAIVTEYGCNVKLTVDNCKFEGYDENTAPMINPTGAKSKIIVTNSVFELGFGCEFYGEESRFTFTNNTFGGEFGFADGHVNGTELSKNCKTFLNGLLDSNEFLGVNKIAVGWPIDFYVNEKF